MEFFVHENLDNIFDFGLVRSLDLVLAVALNDWMKEMRFSDRPD